MKKIHIGIILALALGAIFIYGACSGKGGTATSTGISLQFIQPAAVR